MGCESYVRTSCEEQGGVVVVSREHLYPGSDLSLNCDAAAPVVHTERVEYPRCDASGGVVTSCGALGSEVPFPTKHAGLVSL